MDDRAPRIDPASRRGRKLIDETFRAIAKWRPTCEWGAVVVQPNCAVRIGRLGDVSDRAPADQRTADGRRRESTVPSRKARSAPTRRTDRSNQRAALHQAAQRLCRIRLLKLAQPRRPGAASRTTREDFQMAVGFVFLVLHKESNFFLRFLF